MKRLLSATAALFLLATPSLAYIDASPTLGKVVKTATNIVVLRVEKVSKEKKVILYQKVADLKGHSPAGPVKHQITDGWHPGETKFILDWAEPGRIAVCFHNGRVSETCIGRYWYECSALQPPWWRMTGGQARLAYVYFGPAERLRDHVAAILAGKEVVVTAVRYDPKYEGRLRQRDAADFRGVLRGRDCPLCRVKASLKLLDGAGGPVVGLGIGGPEDVPALVKALGQEDRSARVEAAETLGQIGRPAKAAVSALLRATKDRDGLIRVKAADALQKIGPKNATALPVLVAALKDENAKARRAAAEALGDIGPEAKEAVPALVAALKDADGDVRWAAAETLRDIGPEARAAVRPLLDALKDSAIRSAAAEALGGIGPEAEAAVPALVEALRDRDTGVRRGAAWALVRIDRQGEAATAAALVLVEGFGDHEYLALELLRRVHAPANVPALIRLLKNDNVYTRWMAARILGENGPAAKAAVPALTEALRDKDRSPRIWAAIALGEIGPEAKAAVPALKEASGRDEHDKVRWLAAVALVKITSDTAVVPLLVEALKGPQIDDYFQVRQFATEALGRLGADAKAAAPALREAALKDKYPDIRSAAAAALKKIRWRP